eukprot:4175-Rhodomonas_salina.2
MAGDGRGHAEAASEPRNPSLQGRFRRHGRLHRYPTQRCSPFCPHIGPRALSLEASARSFRVLHVSVSPSP